MVESASRASVVVIGAYGRIGRAVGTLLASSGYDVRGLARQADRPGRPHTPFPVRELADPARLAVDVDGADAVVYAAGAHHGAVELIHELEVFEINAVAALRAALAAAQAGARRFVYLSSTAAMAVAEDPDAAGAYVRSKWLAESILGDAFPRGLTVLRLGWVIDPEDEVAHRRLWPPSGRQVIVGDLPVPMVALHDVAAVVALLCRPELFAAADLAGRIDLVAASPTQSQLYALVSRLAPRPIRVIDARTGGRVARIAAARRRSAEPPTWLTRSTPSGEPPWARYGLTMTTWEDCVRGLWREWADRAEPGAALAVGGSWGSR